MSGRIVAVALGMLLWAAPALAEPPTANWRTLETEHYRFHYPEPYEASARRTAAWAEALFDPVAAHVGYWPEGRTDVLVADPFAAANGFAVPLPDRSRIGIYTTPPASDSFLGHYSDWSEVLMGHEQAHVAHLARPVRHQPEAFLGQFMIPAAGAHLVTVPFWAIEGYATWLEGEFTGTGRPHQDAAHALIRRWALAGELPTYDQIARRSDDWMGSNLGYIFGAAYFEWLAAEYGEESFADVWARLTARERRSFDSAFEGVFGDRPRALYQRFLAEATHHALEREGAVEDWHEGEVWQEFEWNTGRPAVAPDGERLALVERDRDQASVLRVLEIHDNEARFRRWERRQERILEADPEDVKAVRPDSLGRQSLAELSSRQGEDMHDPRWTPDGESLVFTRRSPGFHGFLHSDIWSWNVADDQLERVTRRANLHRPDPIPGTNQVVAVRYQYGFSELVQVDLDSGEVDTLDGPSLKVVHDLPRAGPDGERLVYMRHEAGRWHLVKRERASGNERILKRAGEGGYLTEPEWSPDGETVYFAAGEDGYVNLWRQDLEQDERTRLTRARGLPSGPSPLPDENRLLYRSLELDGWHLRSLDTGNGHQAISDEEASKGFPPRREGQGLESIIPEPILAEDSAYGLGPQRAGAFLAWRWSHADQALDVGVRGGDPVGRLDWLLAGSGSRHGAEQGVIGALRWRGWPAEFEGGLVHESLDPDAQRQGTEPLPEAWKEDRTGAWAGSGWQWRTGPLSMRTEGGIAAHDFSGPAGEDRRSWVYADGWQDLRLKRGDWSLRQHAQAGGLGGGTGDRDWNLWRLRLGVAGGLEGLELGLDAERTRMDGEPEDGEQLRLGGQPGTVSADRVRPFRITDPALFAGTLHGTHHESRELRIGGEFGGFFLRRHRMSTTDFGEGDWLRMRGFQVENPLPDGLLPVPELRGIKGSVGVAQVMDPPLERSVRAWLNLRYTW